MRCPGARGYAAPVIGSSLDEEHRRKVESVPRKNPLTAPLGKIKDTAIDAIKDPRGTAEKVVDQARGTVSLGRSLAGGVAGQVASRVPGRRGTSEPAKDRATPTVKAVPSEEPRPHGDPLQPSSATKKATPAKKTPAKKSPAKAAPAAAKAPAEKTPAKKTPAKRTPAKTVEATPADVAKKVAEKAPAKKAPAAKSAPAKKTPAKKTPAKKAPAKKADPTADRPSAQQRAKKTVTPAKRVSDDTLPDAPGDKLPRRREPEQEPLIDPSTTKQVAGEAERGLKDASGSGES